MHRFKLTLLGCSIVLGVAACGGGSSDSSSTGDDGGNISSSGNIPTRIDIDIPDTLLSSNTRSLRELVIEATEPLATTSFAYEELKNQVSDLKSRLDEREDDLNIVDSIWDDILSSCAGTPDGTACNIPAGQLTITLPEPLPDGTSTVALGETSLTRAPTGIYDYKLETGNAGLGDTEGQYSYTLEWNEDHSKLKFTDTGTENFEGFQYSYSAVLTYTASSDGDSIIVHETSSTSGGGETWNDSMDLTLKEQNNAAHGVLIHADFTSNGFGYQSQYVVDGQADDNGGYIKSKNTYAGGGISDTYFYKESFSGVGELQAAEQCYEITPGFCASPSNWETIPGYMGIPVDDDYYLDDSELDNLDDLLGIAFVSVNGLSNEGAFLVARADAQPPFEGDDDIVCFGSNFEGVAEGVCTVTAEELANMNVRVYEEVFNFTNIEAGDLEISYNEVPGATLDISNGSDAVPAGIPSGDAVEP